MAAESEATGAERIATAIAEDARAILERYMPKETSDVWAEELRQVLHAAAEARAFYREHNRRRAEVIEILQNQQTTLPTEDAKQKFGSIIKRVALATYLTTGE